MSAGGNVREVKALPASKPCKEYTDNLKILYRDSSNPLLPSANLDGVRVRAGEPLNFETLSMSIEPGESAIYARTHVMCSVPGSFIPQGGAVYVLSFTLDTVSNKCAARLEQVEPVRQMVHLSNATRCAP